MPSPLLISEILEKLETVYGSPVWKPRYDALSELIYSVLSQNTSDKNSQPAFLRLRQAFPRWGLLAQASVEDIAATIRSGGLAQIKAPRLREILGQIKRRRGSLNLDFLREWPLPEARAWLTALPGVGPKTAACVLLFSLGRPALPVDTHVHRVSWRLGLIPREMPREKAHQVLESIVPAADIYRFHVLFIQHGRKTCKALRPQCQRCVVSYGCPYYLETLRRQGPEAETALLSIATRGKAK